MKSNIFFAALMCCLSLVFATEVSANSWRVNPDQRAGADFLDLNAAMADERVVDGDILYMDKGSTIATEQTISKKVTIVGPGYFIGENDADEAYFSNTMYLSANGIKITGLHTSTVYLSACNLVIERCRVTGDISVTSSEDCRATKILSCFISGQVRGTGTKSAKWEILNNLFIHDKGTAIYGLEDALIDHNLVRCLMNCDYSNNLNQVFNSTITNNIIWAYDSWYGSYDRSINNYDNWSLSDGNRISHNLFSTKAKANFPNNKFGITALVGEDDLAIFTPVESTEARDNYWIINSNGPAAKYAEDGSDCGPFAGAYPYVLCGYPLYVPRFESITVPSQPNEEGKLIINMKIVNQNQ